MKNELAALRNQVNHKFPPELLSGDKRRTRRLNEADTCGGGRGGRFQGRGRRYQGCGVICVFGGSCRGRYGRCYGGRGNHRCIIQDNLMV